jgi:hypothetical protein
LFADLDVHEALPSAFLVISRRPDVEWRRLLSRNIALGAGVSSSGVRGFDKLLANFS